MQSPFWIRGLVLAVCAVVGLSVVACAGLALTQQPIPWFFLFFEMVVATAVAFGLQVALGRYAAGPAITLLCVAGCIAVASFLGAIGAGGSLHGRDIAFLWKARVLVSGLLVAAAGFEIIRRRPRQSVRLLAIGSALCIPAAIVAVAIKRNIGVAAFQALPPLAQIFAAIFGAAVVGGLFCVGAHCLIRAFEIGVDAAEEAQRSAGDPHAGPAQSNTVQRSPLV